MTNALDVKVLHVQLNATDWAGDDITGHIFKAPTDALGGGLTLLNVSFANGAATGAGTAFTLQLENWGTDGTSVAGTVGSVGGTASPFSASTPVAMTLDDTYKFVDAGQWLVLRKSETNSSDPLRGCLSIQYVMGK